MTDIDLYLDPVCPFAWVTSQWLLDAARASGTPVTVRQMSLAVLNEGNDVDAHRRPMIDRSRRLGRLFAAVADQHGPEGFARLYQALGARIHIHREEPTALVIEKELAEHGFDTALADSLDDPRWDEAIGTAHHRSQEVLGGRGGSPIIAIDGRGFFGPVLTEAPAPQQGAALLDAIVTAATTPGFAVLQRPYQGPPTIGKAEH